MNHQISKTDSDAGSTLARYERLLEISRSLNSILDINALLEQIVSSAAELSNAEAASILLLEKRTGVLRFEAAIDPKGFSLDSIEVPLEGSIAGWVVQNSEPVVIEDVRNDPRFFNKVDEASEFQTRNIMAVPMRARDKIIGCLEALNKSSGQTFTDVDVSTLTTLAAQAAVAIENARLFQQSDFISEMVHELRAPLAAIKTTTYVMGRPEIGEEKRKELIQTIAQEAERLTRMTTEFLDLARLESGRARLARQPLEVAEVVRNTVQMVTPQAEDRKVKLHLMINPPELPRILGDAEKLKQVLLNLLTNAIKYNRENGVVIVQAALDSGHRHSPTEPGGSQHIHVSVEDTGLGIPPESLPHMFEKFYRVADTEGYTTGTGLGLAIARRIIESHGGAITVESQVGVGTKFTFTLPVAK